jgi:DNA-binding PucR family transcriptional regulator
MARTQTRDARVKVEALLRDVAVAHESTATELALAITDRLRETVPEFFADEDVAYDMSAAVAANVTRVQRMLAAGDAGEDGTPREAADLLQSTLQHGIPLISLLEAYRNAQGLAVDWWQTRLERAAPPALLAVAARTLNGLIVAYIDAAAAEIRASYEQERRALESSPDGRRAHLIRKLLAGERLDVDAASRTLNHPLAARHVALVLWRADDEGPDDLLHDALGQVAAACGPVRTLTTSTRHRVYGWMSRTGAIDRTALGALRVPDGVHVAMSGEHTGVDGFVRAHEDAVQTAGALRRRAAVPDGRIAAFEEFELITLLTRDREACDRFVRRVLGRLATDDRDAERARETLRVFLACGSSPSRAAAELGVHRNTVAYRLAALEDVTGPLDALPVGRRLELELALRLVEQQGI